MFIYVNATAEKKTKNESNIVQIMRHEKTVVTVNVIGKRHPTTTYTFQVSRDQHDTKKTLKTK